MARAPAATAPATTRSTAPATTPGETVAALDALGRYDLAEGPHYRQAAKTVLAEVVSHGPALAGALLERVRTAPFPVASVAATAILKITRTDREVTRLADLLAALDLPERDAIWGTRWSLPVKPLAKLLGKRATEVFEAAVLRKGPPPRRRLAYARQVLEPRIARSLVERAVAESRDPSWLVDPLFDDLTVSPGTRERALAAYFARPVPARVGNQRIRTFGRELRHALALDRCPAVVHERLRSQATALAKMMERTYYLAFDELMTSSEMRAARKKLTRDVAPLVDTYEPMKPLYEAARGLRDETPAKLAPAMVSRFRDAIDDGALRWHLASAAIAAAQRRKREVARTLAELVLAADKKDARAAWALAIIDRAAMKPRKPSRASQAA